MTRPRLGKRLARLGAVTVVLGVLITACGEQPEQAAPPDGALRATPSGLPSAEVAAKRPGGPAVEPSPSEAVSLPPGDPGLDAPSVPDPGTAGADAHAHSEARRTVPVEAMLNAADVQMMLGGRGWERRSGAGDECVAPERAVALRTMEYGGTSAGTVTQTVATYADAGAADASVIALRERLEECGWIGVHDPRLGSAAVAADEGGGRSLTAVSVEGALVVLVGTGDVPRDTGRWASLVDLAVGSSCPAAPGGCH
ncbi:MAG TPA: hypothetical protein VFY11_03480 [Nocardioidaceae bacterium]|nr:hypothetical protein [Nocardioidaceae bacterium]